MLGTISLIKKLSPTKLGTYEWEEKGRWKGRGGEKRRNKNLREQDTRDKGRTEMRTRKDISRSKES